MRWSGPKAAMAGVWLVVGCGEAPDLPTGGGEQTVAAPLEDGSAASDDVAPPADTPSAGAAEGTGSDVATEPAGNDSAPDGSSPDASGASGGGASGGGASGGGASGGGASGGGASGGGDANPDDTTGGGADASAFAACVGSDLGSCDFLYVTMQDPDSGLCVQLNLDNCAAYERPGLPVELPLTWRMASALAHQQGRGDCAFGEYYLGSVPALGATGTIAWNDEGPTPSELVIDVTLRLSARNGVPASIVVATSALSEPLARCD